MTTAIAVPSPTAPADEQAAHATRARTAGPARIARIRRAIAAGTYITPEKLDVAMDRLIDDAMPRGTASTGRPRREAAPMAVG